jgi:ornithine carbamoyltransferase
VVRTYSQQGLVDLASAASIPVVNALSDDEHPCQALADLLTVREKKGHLDGVRIAFIGDGNNVSASLALAAARCGAQFVIAAPPGYELTDQVVADAKTWARKTGGSIQTMVSPEEACKDADVIYTDVWTSMGQEASRRAREEAFQGYSVDSELMRFAKADAIFMHDLPAHRGEEVKEDVIDGAQSVIFDQAENRLHAQKALLAAIMADEAAL